MSTENKFFQNSIKALTGISLLAMTACGKPEIQKLRTETVSSQNSEQTTPPKKTQHSNSSEVNHNSVEEEMKTKAAVDTSNGFLNACEKLSQNLSNANSHCYVILEKGKIYAVVLPAAISEQSNGVLQGCLALSQFDNTIYKGLNKVLDVVPSDKTLVISRESGDVKSELVVTNIISEIQKSSNK
jgi:hypothetical protein